MVKGIFGKMWQNWKMMSTTDKVNLIIDAISGVGCGLGSMIAGAKLSEGRNRFEKICIKTATAGLGLAASDISAKALKESYGAPVASLIDKAKGKVNEAKEETAHE